jgi:hypothetical protein
MMPFEMSSMTSHGKVDMLYGENSGTPLCKEFHYELIFT